MTLKSVFVPHLNQNIVFGRKRPVPGGYCLKLRNYLRASLPTPPTSADYTGKAQSSLANIYGNDTLGDCVVAGGYHIVGVETGNAGNQFTATSAQIIKDYSAIGGYVPGNPNTDQGCDEKTALGYWTSHGFADGTKLLGWLAVDPTNKTEMMQALYLFENLYFGIELPDAWINPFPSANGFTWNVAGTADPQNGHCFTGDTKISLLDGRELSFSDLASGKAGESFWVYSCDSTGNVVAGHAHSVRLTRKNAELVKVTLDNGEPIRCTPDHRFLMRDGTYQEASRLKADDSLMPLYRRENENGYEEFSNPRTGGWRQTYTTVAFGVGGHGRGLVAHHYDFNKHNNSPDNLIPMTRSAHRRLHEETSAILKTYSQSNAGREKSRNLMRELWANPQWRAKMNATIIERTSSGGLATAKAGHGFRGMDPNKLHDITHENGLKSIERLTSPENLSKADDARRKKLVTDPEYRASQIRVSIENLKKAQGLPLTQKQIEARRANIVKASEVRRVTQSAPYNHKVVSVEPAGFEDVYDLMVDEHHNFALSSGVFVHNCIIGAGYNSNGVTVDTWGMLGTLTWAAIAEYCVQSAGGELYVMLTPDQLAKGATTAPNGVAWNQLITDFDSLGGNVPVPTPPAPTPPAPTPPAPTPPAPVTTVTLAQAQAWAISGLQKTRWSVIPRTQAETLVRNSLASNWPAGHK